MRGKDDEGTATKDKVGITPAYAGKSSFTNFSNFIFWDHPRLCGEKSSESEVKTMGIGSPPPMRGKAFEKGYDKFTERITPAYAGKSFSCSRSSNSG